MTHHHHGTHPLSTLKKGQGGRVVELEKSAVSLHLMEMGILPGEYIEVSKIAPFGDPMSIIISGYLLSIRKEEAAHVLVELK